MSRMNQLSTYCTTIARDAEGALCVTYHSTVIVRVIDGQITLNTGGWDTVTTRRKMNQAAKQFAFGYSISRRAGTTYVETPAGDEIDMTGRDTVTFAESDA